MEVAEPIGLIFSLTPITNPTSTVLFKCIMAIKTRNAVIFSPHPKAWRCCQEAVRIMYETAVKHGAPEGVFTCLESHDPQDNAYLMHHKDVGLIDATGGPGAVKAAYSSGKPALGRRAGQYAGLSGKDGATWTWRWSTSSPPRPSTTEPSAPPSRR